MQLPFDRRARWIAALILAVACLDAPAAAARPKTRLVSINAAGNGGDNTSVLPQMTPDGRFVVFISRASDLGPTDTNGLNDIYVRDLRTKTTTLVTVNAAGTDAGDAASSNPAISANGRYVLFTSTADDLVAGDNNGLDDVFVRDLKKGITTLVSVNAAGTGPGDGQSAALGITPEGRFALFESLADDLAGSDSNQQFDVFVRDLKKGTTTLVSVNAAGTASGNGLSVGAVITPDARFVAFTSRASDLVAGDTNGHDDVFVRDLKTGAIRLVSINLTRTATANGSSFFPIITPNGRFIVFTSQANDLVAGDSNGFVDVFIRDLKNDTTALVSVNAAGTSGGDGNSGQAIVTPNGGLVFFTSFADDLVAADTNHQEDVFVRDLKTGVTKLVSLNAAGTDSGTGAAAEPRITADGRIVIFESTADDLVANDSNGKEDVFVRNLKKGLTTLASVDAAGAASASGASGAPAVTPDGRAIAFESVANDLVAGDSNHSEDVFVRILK